MASLTPQQQALEERYRASIAQKYEAIEFLGLPSLKDNRPLLLGEIYVPLKLKLDSRDEKLVPVPAALENHPHLMVLGDPGSGKSTLIKVLAYSFGRIQPAPIAIRLGPRVPIPIILRDYKTYTWNDPEDLFRDFIQTLDAPLREHLTPEYFLSLLKEGRGILLIDGLDEVGNVGNRKKLRDNVVLPILEQSRSSYVVLTSRIIGYDEVEFRPLFEPSPGSFFDTEVEGTRRGELKHCHVAPFGEEEIAEFVQRWYAAREADERIRYQKLESLRSALRQNDRIKLLASNPSLLTLMVLVHRVTAELPSGRVKLYDKITEAYLETIERFLGVYRFDASLDQMKRWLAHVGWRMQRRRSKQDKSDVLATEENVLSWLTTASTIDFPNPEETARAFLDYVARRSGLLIPRSPHVFAFIHLTFQEYFAAWHLRGRIGEFNKLARVCVLLVSNHRWHEVLVLLFEMLAEFPGKGDKVVNLFFKTVLTKESLRPVLAEFLAELMLDEQCGLSSFKREQVIQFVFEYCCTSYNEKVTSTLKQLPQTRLSFIHTLINNKLEKGLPDTIGNDFFLTASEFYQPDEWDQTLAAWVKIPQASHPWNVRQVESIIATAGFQPEIIAWGAPPRLPFQNWLSKGFGYYDHLTLSDLYLPEILQVQNQSTAHTLLAQYSVVLRVNRSGLFHQLCSILAQVNQNQISEARDLDRALDLARARALDRALALARARARARDLARDLARALDLARGKVSTFSKFFQNSHGETLTVAKTDWLFFQPEVLPNEFETHIKEVESLTAGGRDDWTRLLGFSCLMLLGHGTPERCRMRNQLLDKGMLNPGSFTFPEELREATATREFQAELPILLQHIFLHKPGDPWIQPEWFEPNNPAYPFFVFDHPRQFYARAAKVLDPKGETELSKWKDADDAIGG